MTTKYQVRATMTECKRSANTVNGNPRYICTLRIDEPGKAIDGYFLQGRTASDHSFTYNMPRVGSTCTVTYHKTPKGNIRFDHMEAV